MAWYRAGTVTVSNGSNVVTGTGTQWAGNVNVGDTIVLGSPPQLYEVANVASNTTIALVTNYSGTSGSGQSYFILATQGWIKELADRAAAVISSYSNIQQAVEDLEQLTTLISQADAQAGTRTDVQGWSSLRVRQAANAAINTRVVSSTADTTAGRLLTTGYAGLLTNSSLTDLYTDTADLNTRDSFSLTRFSRETPNAPIWVGTSATAKAVLTLPVISGRGLQLAFNPVAGANRLSLRTFSETDHHPWEDLRHSGNQLDIGTTATSARTAIQSSIFPAHSKSSVPAASSNANMGIIVSDAASGRRPFWSDGTNWRDATGTILS